MEMKPYICVHKPTGNVRLVEAKNRASARKTAAEHDYEVRQPSYKELLDLGAKQTEIIHAAPQAAIKLNEGDGNGEA